MTGQGPQVPMRAGRQVVPSSEPRRRDETIEPGPRSLISRS
jgi:hypothetical protein